LDTSSPLDGARWRLRVRECCALCFCVALLGGCGPASAGIPDLGGTAIDCGELYFTINEGWQAECRHFDGVEDLSTLTTRVVDTIALAGGDEEYRYLPPCLESPVHGPESNTYVFFCGAYLDVSDGSLTRYMIASFDEYTDDQLAEIQMGNDPGAFSANVAVEYLDCATQPEHELCVRASELRPGPAD